MVAQNGILNEKTEKHKVEEGRKWPQILAILAVSLGPFTNGILFVWTSPFALVLTQDKENYNISEDEASYLIIFQPIGMILANIFIFKLADIIGRKKTMILMALPHITHWIIVIFAKSIYTFYVARFISGFGDACLFCSVPVYVGEISTPKVRGIWGNCPIFFLYGGQFLITVIGSYFDVRTTSYICIGFPILYAIFVSLLPESPYYLIRKGEFEKAKASLKWLRRKANIEDEFINMKADVERQLSETGTWKDLVTITSNRKALRAGIFLRFSQQMCGVAVFATYTQPIFQKAGGDITPQVSSMIFIGLIWILSLFCGISVEKFGRIPSYFYSLLSSAIALNVVALYFFLDQYHLVNVDFLSWVPLAGMIFYVFTYSFGLGVVPTLMLGELFSASIKTKGLCVLIAFFGLAVFLTTNLFHLLEAYVGLYCPFFVFGISCLISTFLTVRWVPETKGKTLEEIQQSLKK